MSFWAFVEGRAQLLRRACWGKRTPEPNCCIKQCNKKTFHDENFNFSSGSVDTWVRVATVDVHGMGTVEVTVDCCARK